MPNILIHLPTGAYPDASRQDLIRRINEAAALAEQLPEHPCHRAMCWFRNCLPANGHAVGRM